MDITLHLLKVILFPLNCVYANPEQEGFPFETVVMFLTTVPVAHLGPLSQNNLQLS